jgi:CelD/BcsL family acetyltransferase involved in cellulose biosynthesis
VPASTSSHPRVQPVPVQVTVDPLADPRWRELVERAPEGAVFHHPGWLRLLRTTYRYEMSACCLAGRDGRLVAGLPVADVSSRLTGGRLVAVPFADLCPPLLVRPAPPETAPALAAALDALHRMRGMPLEVRGTGEVLERAPPGKRFHHHVLPLESDVEAIQRRFTRSQVLRGVRRALREGLRAEMRTDRVGLATFYRLHMATRRRLGVPTQPRRFILGFGELFDQGLGFVLLVRGRDRVVAAAVFLTCGGVLTYKYGASDARFLATRPNNLLFMEAIRWGCENGFHALDFGRTHWGQDGLRAFKLSWGSDETELRYRYVGGAEPGGRNGRLEGVLARVIRRSPPLASRVIGEVLYRHAG